MQGEKMKAKLIMSILLLACSSWLVVGCQKEGAGERAGKKVDQATEQANQRLEEGGRAAQENTDRAVKKFGDEAEEAGDTIQEKTR
jgi:hypothetical protein